MKPAEAFRYLVVQIADEFEQSDLTYTCRAIPMAFARKRIVPLANDPSHPAHEYRVHPQFTFRRIEKAVADEVHRRWLNAS